MAGDADADRMAQIALTVSRMRAHHDGGPQHGEFYDSDFGGARYADGDGGQQLVLLPIVKNQRVKSLFARSMNGLNSHWCR